MGTNKIHQYETVMVTEIGEFISKIKEQPPDTSPSEEYQRSRIERQVSEFSGKILTYEQSNAVISFKNALEAILCGISLQEEGIAWCSGIHGGLVKAPAEQYGDDIVDFAFVLRKLAGAGDIVISDSVQNSITEKNLFKTTSLGSYTSEFTNQPVGIYSINNVGRKASTSDEIHVQEKPDAHEATINRIDNFDGIFKNNVQEEDTSSGKLLNDFQNRLSRNTDYAFSAVTKPFSREAYEAYVKGTFYWETWTNSSIQKAVKCFQKAITISPQYTEAYGWLALCYCFLGITGKEPSLRAFEKADRILKKAKTIDTTTGEVFVAQGMVNTFLYHDFKMANDAFRQAFNHKKSPHFYHLYARFLLTVGKVESAVRFMEKALQLEPDNVLFNAELAECYYYNRHYTEALELFNYTLDLEPSCLSALTGKGWTHIVLGEYDEAHEAFETYQNLVYHEQKNVPQLVYLSARLGMTDVAKYFLDVLQLGEELKSNEVTSIDIALIYLALDKHDEAFYHLQCAVDDFIGEALYIKSNPLWDSLRSDIRYKKLLRQMNLIDTEYFLSELSC